MHLKNGCNENGHRFKTKENNVIRHQSKSKGKMWADVSNTQLLKLLEKDNSIYEVIHSFPHKVYFDIDFQDRYKK